MSRENDIQDTNPQKSHIYIYMSRENYKIRKMVRIEP